MNPHLIRIPRLTSLTTRRLSRRNLESLRRQTDGSAHAQVLALRALDQLRAHFLESLHFARGEGDADFVDLGALAEVAFGVFAVGHGCCGWLVVGSCGKLWEQV